MEVLIFTWHGIAQDVLPYMFVASNVFVDDKFVEVMTCPFIDGNILIWIRASKIDIALLKSP